MLSETKVEFTKDNIDAYLKEVAKIYRKQCGKNMPAELILIGGASVLINYGFRNMTTDIDAVIQAASAMKDAINRTGDKFGLPNGWLNADFTRTTSYSPHLAQYSLYYKTFSNVLTIRTVSAEYLIAMKLRSGRQYKNDFSDILGILSEHEKQGNSITMDQIKNAVKNLYGNWEALSEISKSFIEDAMRNGEFEKTYEEIAEKEKEAGKILLRFEHTYPNVLKGNNADAILEQIREEKKSKEDILEKLQEMQKSKPLKRTDGKEKETGGGFLNRENAAGEKDK